MLNVFISVHTNCLCNIQSEIIIFFLERLMLVLIPAAERTEERKLEEKLLEAAREGDLSTLTQLVSART